MTANAIATHHFAVRAATTADIPAVTAFLEDEHLRGRCLHHYTPECDERFPGHLAATDALVGGHGYIAFERERLVGAVWFDPDAEGGPAIGIATGDADDRTELRRVLIKAGRRHAVEDHVRTFTMKFPAGHPELTAALEEANIHVDSLISYGGTSEVTLTIR